MKSDSEIARGFTLTHINQIAEKAGIKQHELTLCGEEKAKVDLSIFKRLKERPNIFGRDQLELIWLNLD